MQTHSPIPVSALLAQAAKDPAFRQELVNQPKVVLQRDFGVTFSDTCSVRVLEENDESVYVLIPRTMVLTDQEQDITTQVVSRAMTDDDYRAQLLADPRGSLEAAFGIGFPANVEINVLADSDNEIHIVLPSMFQAGVLVDEVRAAGWGGPDPTEGGSSCTQCGHSTCTSFCTTNDVPNCPGGPGTPEPPTPTGPLGG
ncbi:MAG: nitrile hydratase subunit alpha [Myxococcota bacterium]